MTTSNTATFNLDLGEIVEEAFERCGAELRTGYDLRTARPIQVWINRQQPRSPVRWGSVRVWHRH